MKLFREGYPKSNYAIPTTIRVALHGRNDFYMGVVKFYDTIYLFKLRSNIVRGTKEDALIDAIDLAVDNGFERP